MGKRYYLFSFSWVGNGQSGFGSLRVVSDSFPSRKWLTEQAAGLDDGFALSEDSIVILGWTEFKSEDDFLLFQGEKNEHPAITNTESP